MIINLLILVAIVCSLFMIVYEYVLRKELKVIAKPLIDHIELDQKSFELLEQCAISIKEMEDLEELDSYMDTIIRLCKVSQIGPETLNLLKTNYLNEE